MSHWWQSYKSKSSKKHRDFSIAKDEATLLAERLEFFVPNFTQTFSLSRVLVCVFTWALFTMALELEGFSNWQNVLIYYLIHFLILLITVYAIVFFVNIQRPYLKNIRIINACLRILLTSSTMAVIAAFNVLFWSNFFGFIDFSFKKIMSITVLHTVNTAGLTILIIIYYIRRQRELLIIQKYFEHKLATQNEYINARLEPHVLFNTINTLISLIEVENQKQYATDMLQHLAYLFRMSFNEPTEIHFEDEIELCEHYLAIEHYRLQDRLEVNWTLPDDSIIHDMSITSFSMLNVLEKTILYVAGLSIEKLCIDIKVEWQNNRVIISISVNIPKTLGIVDNQIKRHLDFSIQSSYLRHNFGNTASVVTNIENNCIINRISYPLHDAIF